MLLLKFCVFLFLNAKPPKEFFTAVVGCFFVAVFVVHLLFLIVVVGVGSFCVCGVEKYLLLFSLLSVFLKLDTHARQRGHRHHLYSVTKWGGGSKFEKSRGEGKEKKKSTSKKNAPRRSVKALEGHRVFGTRLSASGLPLQSRLRCCRFCSREHEEGLQGQSRENIKNGFVANDSKKKKCGERNKCTPRCKRTLEATAKAWDS